jgi:RNA recognition motif-containing protein
MRTLKIFVEGIIDKKFIEDYIVYWKIDTSKFEFSVVDLGGKADDRFEKNLPQFNSSDKNLVIVDADGNCAARKAELERLKISLDISFDLFLLPNDSDNGELETLLKSIVWEKYQNYFSWSL